MKKAKNVFSVQFWSILAILAFSVQSFAQNTIDWRYGRPGVQVVTNAVTATETTNIVNNALGPIAAKTNNWDTAFGWGNHAGLYRDILWVPTWAEVTGKPEVFTPEAHTHNYTDITNPPWLTSYTETDPVASSALAAYAAYWPRDATASSWFTFTTNANEITITGNNIGGGTDVVIPDYINGFPVTKIGEAAFGGSSVSSINGAGNVVTIGNNAFGSCYSLTSVDFPAVTSIGDSAFVYCYYLTSVDFPAVTSIGNSAFESCYSLTPIDFPAVTSIGDSAFGSCESLTSIDFPAVTSIGESAFEACSSLTNIDFPAVTSIGDNAFDFCVSLTSVDFPAVTSIGDYAFNICESLTNITTAANAPTVGDSAFSGTHANLVITVTDPQATGWGATLSDGTKDVPVVRLPLYADAIYQGGKLVATIDDIPEVPEEVGKAVTVTGSQSNDIAEAKSHVAKTDNPHGVTAEQIGALTSEQDLAALRIYHYGSAEVVESPEAWFVFDGAGTITGYNYVAGREDVVIPWEIGGVPVTAIGAGAFTDSMFDGYPIKTVIAPKTVTSIGYYAFGGCSSLTSVDFPAVTSIGNNAFGSCYSLTSIDFPAVTSIGDYAFMYCSSLTSIDFPAVMSIGYSAFESCDSLTSIDFPALTSIGNDSFVFCSSLTSITTAANAPTVGVGAFSATHANLVITVTDPQATGWGATLSDGSTAVPVVRPDLYADAFHGSGANLTGVIKPADLTAQYSAWTTNVVSSGTNVITAAWGNQPRLELTDAGVIDFDFGTPSSGLHRLTLSLWSGTHSVAWLTNNVDFAEAPELSTNAYNTILIRKIGSAKAEGRQL